MSETIAYHEHLELLVRKHTDCLRLHIGVQGLDGMFRGGGGHDAHFEWASTSRVNIFLW